MDITIPARPGYSPKVITDLPEGATLRDAVIKAAKSGAYLTGAYLTGAYLRGAYLTGAYLRGLLGETVTADKIIVGIVGRTTRSDGYEFILWRMEDNSLFVRAGCQSMVIAKYREHLKRYRSIAKQVETTLILDFLEAKTQLEAWG